MTGCGHTELVEKVIIAMVPTRVVVKNYALHLNSNYLF